MKTIVVALLTAAVLALMLIPAPAEAYTCTGSTCTPTIQYSEPSTYVGGLPLTNLQDGKFDYQINGGPTKTRIIPATRPQGGGTVADTGIAESVPACTVATMTGSLVMRTTAGGVSAPTPLAAPLVMDRTKLANGQPDPACVNPNPATGLTAN